MCPRGTTAPPLRPVAPDAGAGSQARDAAVGSGSAHRSACATRRERSHPRREHPNTTILLPAAKLDCGAPLLELRTVVRVIVFSAEYVLEPVLPVASGHAIGVHRLDVTPEGVETEHTDENVMARDRARDREGSPSLWTWRAPSPGCARCASCAKSSRTSTWSVA